MDISTSTVRREAGCNTHSAHRSVPEIEKFRFETGLVIRFFFERLENWFVRPL
jgi:hypothetical protein